MEYVVAVIHQCARHGGSGALRTLSDFLACSLCAGYTIRDWLKDNSVESEKRTRFKTAVTKGPFVDEWIAGEEQRGALLYEFYFAADRVYGLGAGYLFESPTVSLRGDARFEVDPVTIRVSSLDAQLQFASGDKAVCSLTNVTQVSNRAAWIRERLQRDIANGITAWERHAELFPNLTFCSEAATFLQSLSGSEAYFYQVCRHLLALNSFCAEWPQQGISALSSIRWSDESKSTLNNDVLRKMREFLCPDGQRRLFSLHTKPTGGNIRIHFLVLSQERRIMIGYIGRHLAY